MDLHLDLSRIEVMDGADVGDAFLGAFRQSVVDRDHVLEVGAGRGRRGLAAIERDVSNGRLPGRRVAVPDLRGRIAVAVGDSVGCDAVRDHLDPLVVGEVVRHVARASDVEHRPEAGREALERAGLDLLSRCEDQQVLVEELLHPVDELRLVRHAFELEIAKRDAQMGREGLGDDR